MSTEYAQVVDDIWIGSYYATKSKALLGIVDAVINVSEKIVDIPEIVCYNIPFPDVNEPDPEKYSRIVISVGQALSALRYEMGKNSKVLVNCMGGVNRSGLVIAAYLISYGHDAEEAIDIIRNANSTRKIPALCNPTFCSILEKYEHELLTIKNKSEVSIFLRMAHKGPWAPGPPKNSSEYIETALGPFAELEKKTPAALELSLKESPITNLAPGPQKELIYSTLCIIKTFDDKIENMAGMFVINTTDKYIMAPGAETKALDIHIIDLPHIMESLTLQLFIKVIKGEQIRKKIILVDDSNQFDFMSNIISML